MVAVVAAQQLDARCLLADRVHRRRPGLQEQVDEPDLPVGLDDPRTRYMTPALKPRAEGMVSVPLRVAAGRSCAPGRSPVAASTVQLGAVSVKRSITRNTRSELLWVASDGVSSAAARVLFVWFAIRRV